MPWKKEHERGPGELEFHFANETPSRSHDEKWIEKRVKKLEGRHHH